MIYSQSWIVFFLPLRKCSLNSVWRTVNGFDSLVTLFALNVLQAEIQLKFNFASWCKRQVFYFLKSIEMLIMHRCHTENSFIYEILTSKRRANFPTTISEHLCFGIFSAWNTISVNNVQKSVSGNMFHVQSASPLESSLWKCPFWDVNIFMAAIRLRCVSIVNLKAANEPCK